MKLRLCIHQKAGAPGYGSDGAGAELELEIDEAIGDNPAALAQHGAAWYGALERMVGEQIARMQSRHADGSPPLENRSEPPARSGGGEDGPPRREGPPPRSGGSGGGEGRSDAPTNGKQLLGWANKTGHYDQLMRLAKQHDMGRIVDLDRDQIDWLHRELSRGPAPAWGGGGRG